jgi:hypothetical protein
MSLGGVIRMPGAGACAGSCNDLTATEEQISIGKRDRGSQKYSARPSASCFSSRESRHLVSDRRHAMNY